METIYNIKLLEEYIKKHNLTKSEFCKLCGICQKSLNLIFNSKNVRLMTILKIVITTKFKMSDLLFY